METRGWDDGRQSTYHMRPKEQSDDYRYFPEPDLPPLHVDAAWLEAIRARCRSCRRPAATRYRRRHRAVGLRRGGPRQRPEHVGRLRGDRRARRRTCRQGGREPRDGRVRPPRARDRRSRGDRARRAGRRRVAGRPPPGRPGRTPVADQRPRRARRAPANGSRPQQIIAREGFSQISDGDTLDGRGRRRARREPGAVADYRAGKAQAVGFLVGQVMKATRGQANAAQRPGGAPRAPGRG